MSEKENKELIRRYYEEVFNERKQIAIEDYFSMDYVDHTSHPGTLSGFKERERTHTMILNAFPDIHIDIEDLIAEGDRVVIRCTASGTHLGKFMEVPPTGKKMKIMEIYIYRLIEGKIVGRWGLYDRITMMQQLGVSP